MINRMLSLSDKQVFAYSGNEKLFANKRFAAQEAKSKQVKRIEVLIDLLGYGIVALPVAYSLNFTDVLPRICNIECHIEPLDAALHSWLHSPDFKLVFSEIGNGKGHMVSFSGKGINKNVYYQTMLNVVSDYILIREKIFI